MKVKLLVSLSGIDEYFSAGSVQDYPSTVAEALIAEGHAEALPEPERPVYHRRSRKVETATAPSPETRD